MSNTSSSQPISLVAEQFIMVNASMQQAYVLDPSLGNKPFVVFQHGQDLMVAFTDGSQLLIKHFSPNAGVLHITTETGEILKITSDFQVNQTLNSTHTTNKNVDATDGRTLDHTLPILSDNQVIYSQGDEGELVKLLETLPTLGSSEELALIQQLQELEPAAGGFLLGPLLGIGLGVGALAAGSSGSNSSTGPILAESPPINPEQTKPDIIPPNVMGVEITSSEGAIKSFLNAEDTVQFTLSFNEAVVIDMTNGRPELALNIGGEIVNASYKSGSGSMYLVFSCSIFQGNNDHDGISIEANGLGLNGAIITDLAGNKATTQSLSYSQVQSNQEFKVDTEVEKPLVSEIVPIDTGARLHGTGEAGALITIQGFKDSKGTYTETKTAKVGDDYLWTLDLDSDLPVDFMDPLKLTIWQADIASNISNNIPINFYHHGSQNMNGADGEDLMIGNDVENLIHAYEGNDTVFGGDAADRLHGDEGDDTLYGQKHGDMLFGGKGNDILIGGMGEDFLHGGAGSDAFVFDSKLLTNQYGHADVIVDFNISQTDMLWLDASIFESLTLGKIYEDQFVSSNTGSVKALDADDFLLYDQTNGKLYYDADGSNMAIPAILFASFDDTIAASFDASFDANLDNSPIELNNSHFVVI